MSSNYFNSKQSSPRHIIMKLLKITDKERILKSSNKKDGNLQRNLHWTISVFLRRKVSGRREWNDVFKVLKEKNGHQEYSIGKFIFQKWRINKDFPRQTKTEGLYTRFALLEMLEGVLYAEIKRCWLITWKHTKIYNTQVKANIYCQIQKTLSLWYDDVLTKYIIV